MNAPTLFDGLHVRADDPDTSRAAADSIRPVLGLECQRVLDVVKLDSWGGATAWEVVRNLALHGIERDQNVVARRLSDLRDAGLVVDSGLRRPGRSSRLLIVWKAVES